MLAELIERLLTSVPRPIREMGYLRELIGIRKRSRQCAAACGVLPAQGSTRAVQQRADRRLGEAEAFGDVVVAETLDLARPQH